jgi:hypothetical protein
VGWADIRSLLLLLLLDLGGLRLDLACVHRSEPARNQPKARVSHRQSPHRSLYQSRVGRRHTGTRQTAGHKVSDLRCTKYQGENQVILTFREPCPFWMIVVAKMLSHEGLLKAEEKSLQLVSSPKRRFLRIILGYLIIVGALRGSPWGFGPAREVWSGLPTLVT